MVLTSGSPGFLEIFQTFFRYWLLFNHFQSSSCTWQFLEECLKLLNTKFKYKRNKCFVLNIDKQHSCNQKGFQLEGWTSVVSTGKEPVLNFIFRHFVTFSLSQNYFFSLSLQNSHQKLSQWKGGWQEASLKEGKLGGKGWGVLNYTRTGLQVGSYGVSNPYLKNLVQIGCTEVSWKRVLQGVFIATCKTRWRVSHGLVLPFSFFNEQGFGPPCNTVYKGG